MNNTVHEETYRGCKIRLEPDDDLMSPREWDNVGLMVCWHRHYNLGDEQPKDNPTEYLEGLVMGEARKALDELEERDHRAQMFVRDWDSGWWRGIDKAVEARRKKIISEGLKEFVILPLYLYDHGGISMSTGSFGDPWDSGQVGYVYCSLDKARHEWGRPDSTWESPVSYGDKTMSLRDAAVAHMTAEVKTYDDFLQGNVVGFITEDWDGDHIDSCWGFYPEGDKWSERWSYVLSEARTSIDHHIERCAMEAPGEH